MTPIKYDNIREGDIAFVDAGTGESGSKCGEVIKVNASGGPDAPHIKIKTLTGEHYYDYREVISLGRIRYVNSHAMIKIVCDPDRWRETKGRTGTPRKEREHQEWPISGVVGVVDAVSDRRWALVEDPYTKQTHWMQKHQTYRFYISDISYISVQLEGIPPNL